MKRSSKVMIFLVGLSGYSASSAVVTEVIPAPAVPTALVCFGLGMAYSVVLMPWVRKKEGP